MGGTKSGAAWAAPAATPPVALSEEVSHDHVQVKNCFVSKTIPILLQYKIARHCSLLITQLAGWSLSFKGKQVTFRQPSPTVPHILAILKVYM